jgi:hypothetical protein
MDRQQDRPLWIGPYLREWLSPVPVDALPSVALGDLRSLKHAEKVV